jgi:hypothetical protein
MRLNRTVRGAGLLACFTKRRCLTAWISRHKQGILSRRPTGRIALLAHRISQTQWTRSGVLSVRGPGNDRRTSDKPNRGTPALEFRRLTPDRQLVRGGWTQRSLQETGQFAIPLRAEREGSGVAGQEQAPQGLGEEEVGVIGG